MFPSEGKVQINRPIKQHNSHNRIYKQVYATIMKKHISPLQDKLSLYCIQYALIAIQWSVPWHPNGQQGYSGWFSSFFSSWLQEQLQPLRKRRLQQPIPSCAISPWAGLVIGGDSGISIIESPSGIPNTLLIFLQKQYVSDFPILESQMLTKQVIKLYSFQHKTKVYNSQGADQVPNHKVIPRKQELLWLTN